MTKLEEARARLAAAQEEVARFEGDAAFMARLKMLEAATVKTDAALDAARDAVYKTQQEVGQALGFYTLKHELRRSYLDLIGALIGIDFDDRKHLARGNRTLDDPFADAARRYAHYKIEQSPRVAAARARVSEANKLNNQAETELRDFARAYRSATRSAANAKYLVSDAERAVELRKARTPPEKKEGAAKFREARKLLAAIGEGKIDLKVTP